MRQAILHLAFAGLGAEEARSGAFADNAASLHTSRSVGYVENGVGRGPRRDGAAPTINLLMDRATWAGRRRDDIELIGLEGCLDMFLGPAA
jgi:RimJ/RimL family protein N-acetyltransferase